MNKREFYQAMEKLGNIEAYINILNDYLEAHLDTQQVGYAFCLTQQLTKDTQILYNQLDTLSFELFDFQHKNLK